MAPGLGFGRHWAKSHLYRCLVSLFFVSVSHFALVMVPSLLPSLPLLSTLSISALVLVASAAFGQCCRRILHVSASAPSLVVFNVLFIWGVYNSLIREGCPSMKVVVVNTEFALLVIGLYSILSGNPGFVYNSFLDKFDQSAVSKVGSCSEDEVLSSSSMDYEQPCVNLGKSSLSRVRYCITCRIYVRGFDHHCPAFGNCIGQKNHQLFMALLTGFIIAEASYIGCSCQFIARSRSMHKTAMESSLSNNLAISTMLFCVLQVPWQMIFLIWHIYCICFNIKTDEWINWRKYSEFHFVVQHPGQPFEEVRFGNPYDKGLLGNIKDFLFLKE